MPDTLGMFDAAAGMPEQVATAARRAWEVDGLPDHDDVEHVVVLGMGGSGLAGDVLAAVAGPFMPVPVLGHKGYGVPAFVDRHTLVFAVSCSGDTEETLEATTAARHAGAPVVTLSQGGQLAGLAREWGTPHVAVDPALPAPRAAFGALATPMLVLCERLGLFPGARAWIDCAVEQLQRRRDELRRSTNLAAELADRLDRAFPLVYGAGGIGQLAAARWKAQCNENAKVPAFSNAYPELCHNEIVGWGQHGDVTRQVFRVVTLRHEFEHPQIDRRVAFVDEVMREVVGGQDEVVAAGEGSLAQLYDLVLVGDFVSLHLAARAGVDPGPVPVIDELKEALAAPGVAGLDPAGP